MIPDQSKADFSLALHRNDTFTILDQLEMVSTQPDEPVTLTTQNSTAENPTMIRQTGPSWNLNFLVLKPYHLNHLPKNLSKLYAQK